MKNIIKYSLFLSLVLAFASCEKFLDISPTGNSIFIE